MHSYQGVGWLIPSRLELELSTCSTLSVAEMLTEVELWVEMKRGGEWKMVGESL